MNTAIKNSSPLRVTFDVGHSSLGWAVFDDGTADPIIEGCGAVIFRADDCLASARRGFRRQRRHIRATRRRIARLKLILEQLGVLSSTALDRPGCAWPWLLAARALRGEQTLTWAELWDVLRWYAHNRGYDGNRRWSGQEAATLLEDTEKEQNARSLMQQHGTASMAETMCAVLKIDPARTRKASHIRFKGMNAAFPREVVEKEVETLLRLHEEKLPGVDAKLREVLLADWRAIPCEAIRLPQRFQGGLLFGQLVPRFDNRIIAKCPISGQKVPSRNVREFFDFRWAMQVANIRVGGATGELAPLTAQQRHELDAKARERGYLTSKQLTDTVRTLTGCVRDNLDTMLMHPDAKEALLIDPVRKAITSDLLGAVWSTLPERLRKRASGKLKHGQILTLDSLRAQLIELGEAPESFDAAMDKLLLGGSSKGKRKQKPVTREELLAKQIYADRLDRRAPYGRAIMRKAVEEVFAGSHPKEEGGCLFRHQKLRDAELKRAIDEQTNNHLVRHRLRILERLFADIVKTYAGGDRSRVTRVVIEVTRDLREMSGKTNKQKAQDMGLRLDNFKKVVEKLEDDEGFMRELARLGMRKISPGLIRKARIAEDLGWVCPYTGQKYEPIDLLTRRVDKDHIVPRADRASDSLDSLVITFSAVNKWKGKRTALKFVQDEGGKSVPDLPNLTMQTPQRYLAFVEALESYKGHDDEKRRKKRRKALLGIALYEEKEFVPGDLTQTSQLVRLGASMIRRQFLDDEKKPVVISLPGSVTGTLRKGWNRNLLGCLSGICPQVLDENKELKNKSDIRDITHLHHALDACVLGLADHFIGTNGAVWALVVKRKLEDFEKLQLRALGIFDFSAQGFGLKALPEVIEKQVRQRLAERRVVQHLPTRKSGLRVEQNTWRVLSINDGEATLVQRMRQPDGKRVVKYAKEKVGKLLGVSPLNGNGKLEKLKGALVISDNYGVALDPTPTIIPFHNVWKRLGALRKTNGGKMPRVLRNGQLIRFVENDREEIWRVFSIKNTARGIMLDIGKADAVAMSRGGNRLTSFLKNKMEVLQLPLTGIAACPSILSA